MQFIRFLKNSQSFSVGNHKTFVKLGLNSNYYFCTTLTKPQVAYDTPSGRTLVS